MRSYVNAVSRWLTILLSSTYWLMVACHASYEPLTQPDPTSINETYMVYEVGRFTPMLAMGEFIATFGEPTGKTADGRPYAGWGECLPQSRPPHYVHFNQEWINSFGLDDRVPNGQLGRDYLSALVGHEMCHYWVSRRTGGCYDEMAAEICANNLVTLGRPE